MTVNSVHSLPQYSAAETRVLDAAYDLYTTDGMEALSMRRIAAAIGVTAPALYKQFSDKDALIEAIAERGFHLFEQRLTAAVTSRSALRNIAQVLQSYRDFAVAEPHLFEIMFVEPRVRLRRFPDDFAAGRSTAFNMLRAAVDRALAEKRLRKDDSVELTLNLWAYAHGLVGLYRAGRFDNDTNFFNRLFDRSLQRLLTGLTP